MATATGLLQPQVESNIGTEGYLPKERQIRAQFDGETITVYQAYNSHIASSAVQHQRLSSSPHFRPGRMTWIKPSWCWMMYRSGYSYKDRNQEHILALKMKHEHFIKLLKGARLTTKPGQPAVPKGAADDNAAKEKTTSVRVQWDPERSPRLEKLSYRNIQVGIPGSLAKTWADDFIVEIQDVTGKARSLEKELRVNQTITEQELIEKGLVPLERDYTIPIEVQERIGMV